MRSYNSFPRECYAPALRCNVSAPDNRRSAPGGCAECHDRPCPRARVWAGAGREVSEADADALNDALQKLNAGSLVVPVPGQVAWQWVEKSSGVARLLGRIVRSAVKLLTSEDIERVKRCAAEKCCWLFMDGSRSRNRRWCEMRTCGSQHKAKAYYKRKTVVRKHGAAAKLG